MGTRIFSARQQLDWEVFNRARVTAFYSWLCDAIKTRYPADKTTTCFAKTSNSASGIHPVTREWPVQERGDPDGGAHGIDRERLFGVFGMQACDTRMVPQAQPHFPVARYPDTLYAPLDWLSTAASYDFMRSSTKHRQLLLETEWHSISTVSYRQQRIPSEHVRAGLWIAHMHGMGANMIWYWGRDGWTGRPKRGSGFWGSIAMQPLAFNAYARGAVEMKAVATHVEQLASRHAQINLFYSPESLAMDKQSIEDTFACYSLLHSLGVTVGFTVGSTPGVPTVVAGASYVSAHAVKSLQEAETRGDVVLLTGNRSNAFGRTDRGVASPTAVRSWAASLEYLPMEMADRTAFRAFDTRLSPLLNRTVRCVSPASSFRDSGPRPTLFGVMCRFAREEISERDISLTSDPGSLGPPSYVVFALNLLRIPVPLSLEVAGLSGNMTVENILTGDTVVLPLTLPPLQPYLLRVVG